MNYQQLIKFALYIVPNAIKIRNVLTVENIINCKEKFV